MLTLNKVILWWHVDNTEHTAVLHWAHEIFQPSKILLWWMVDNKLKCSPAFDNSRWFVYMYAFFCCRQFVNCIASTDEIIIYSHAIKI